MKGYIQTCLLALAAVALGQQGLGDLPDCAVRTKPSPPLLFFFWAHQFEQEKEKLVLIRESTNYRKLVHPIFQRNATWPISSAIALVQAGSRHCHVASRTLAPIQTNQVSNNHPLPSSLARGTFFTEIKN